MTVRKNFNFDEETAHSIEEIAAQEGITQTEAVKRAIELLKKEQRRKRRLAAMEHLEKSPPANIGDIDIRQLRIEKALKHAE